jgi:hypothetical protein
MDLDFFFQSGRYLMSCMKHFELLLSLNGKDQMPPAYYIPQGEPKVDNNTWAFYQTQSSIDLSSDTIICTIYTIPSVTSCSKPLFNLSAAT